MFLKPHFNASDDLKFRQCVFYANGSVSVGFDYPILCLMKVPLVKLSGLDKIHGLCFYFEVDFDGNFFVHAKFSAHFSMVKTIPAYHFCICVKPLTVEISKDCLIFIRSPPLLWSN